ncbi:MAG: hypothetical protein ACI4FY_05500 [Acetatifactor sp.]
MKKYGRQLLIIGLLAGALTAAVFVGFGRRERDPVESKENHLELLAASADEIPEREPEDERELGRDEKNTREQNREQESYEELRIEASGTKEPGAEEPGSREQSDREPDRKDPGVKVQGSEEQSTPEPGSDGGETHGESLERKPWQEESGQPQPSSGDRDDEQTKTPDVNEETQPIRTQESESPEAEHLHYFEKVYWYGEPSCGVQTNYYNLVCRECGAYGGDGEDVIDHTPIRKESVSYEGCIVYKIVEVTCEKCGASLGREAECIGEQHQWVTGEGTTVWNEEVQDFVTPTIEYCAKCFVQR